MGQTNEMANIEDVRRQESQNKDLKTPFLGKKQRKLPLVTKRGELNVETRGLPKTVLYGNDMFHTLINMPSLRFSIVLLCTYFLLFFTFAIPFYYDACHNLCIPGVQTFSHAFWFSVQTSMTIGYGGDLTPDPNCTMTNMLVITQSFASLIIAYSLLGVFYARFSLPTRRAHTFLFSRKMVLHEVDGVPVLIFRMANLRKHQIIEAHVRLLVGQRKLISSEDESDFQFTSLPVLGGSEVFLGLPCTVKHPITSSSFLYGRSLEEMEDADLEFLVLLEGVDASTSSKLQARYSYQPCDICENSCFEAMVTRLPNGRRCVNFAKFDSILPMPASMGTRHNRYSSLASLTLLAERGLGFSNGDSTRDDRKLLETRLSKFQGSLDLDRTTPKLSFRSAEAVRPIWLRMPDLHGVNELKNKVPLKTSSHSHKTSGLNEQHNVWPASTSAVYSGLNHMKKSRSLPDLRMFLSRFETPEDRIYREHDEEVMRAEANAKAWRKMLIELSVKVQQTLQQRSTTADADAGQLVGAAKLSLSHALLSS